MNDELICNVCGEKFKDPILFGRHQIAKHPDGDSIADLQPESAGEMSVSGSSPDPESDDDTLENAQQVGEQIGEDEEHPKELNLARDIDNGEEYIRTH